ncbi:MAG: hypothetical protein HYT62_02265 [Candidatus Yanofskybacteria bacterium]|nr:hypothetical protein [Candidatus Yanofskybacteria bacterium]
MTERHIVGYTHAFTCGHNYGERFDRLKNCCEKFQAWFTQTGNTKHRSFNSRYPEERAGINLVQRGGISLVLRLTDPAYEDDLNFCPFCGAEIVLKCTKSVELRPKTKQVPDGYEEIIRQQSPDQTTHIKAELTQESDNRLDYGQSKEEGDRRKEIGNRIDELVAKR